ncbi:MAG: Flp family type IVb pilin [Desulfuromonadales bacterium]
MEKMKNKMMQLWKDEEGATMVEYGIMVALIAAVCIGVITTLGTTVESVFTDINGQVNGVGDET